MTILKIPKGRFVPTSYLTHSMVLLTSQSRYVKSSLPTLIQPRFHPRFKNTVPVLPARWGLRDFDVSYRRKRPIRKAVGKSGCHYQTMLILSDKFFGRLYVASAGKEMFILREVLDPPMYLDLYRRLGNCPYVRLVHDTISNPPTFVFKYFTGNLLNLVHYNLSLASTKRILKDTLRGLAALHDQNIVHGDVKPENVVIEWEPDRDDIKITQVQLTDLENAVWLPHDSTIIGCQVGTYMWRSPEAHAAGLVHTSSDIFSFGIVCIYAVLRKQVLAITEDDFEETKETERHALERQAAYFLADEDEFDVFGTLMRHLGDNNPYCEIFRDILEGFNETNPRWPVSQWDIDADFKDLIEKLTRLAPVARITAKQALAHKWLEGV